MSEKTVPLAGQVFQSVQNFDSYDAIEGRFDTVDAAEAQVTTSRVAGRETHKVVLDIDLPAKLIPSSTADHFHLYIDHEIPWHKYERLLLALADAGIVEEGYVRASIARQFTAARLPWVKKLDAVEPTCVGCGKGAHEFVEQIDLDEYTDATQWARDDGTYNSVTNHFYCDRCYIAAGTPLGVAS